MEAEVIKTQNNMFNLFLAVSPEIFLINATFILLIHEVVFSTSKKDDYPPLVSNVGWLGLLSRFDAFEFIVLIPLPTRSMLLMIPAHDLIAMYLAIELQSLCFYVIAASKRKSEFSMEASSKYLILGAFPSGILLFGCDRTTTDQFLETSL
uniref:NADH:quinone oxidoreductase/Mrp antiporter transmembrane domain-containing protein n=1 Tax=Setaria italica TaxID=4555 RepID=K4AK30_SETIT